MRKLEGAVQQSNGDSKGLVTSGLWGVGSNGQDRECRLERFGREERRKEKGARCILFAVQSR